MSDEEILEIFRRAAWENQQLKLEAIDTQATILELGIESIAMAEIVAELEDELDIQVPDEIFAEARSWSVARLITYLRQLAEAAS